MIPPSPKNERCECDDVVVDQLHGNFMCGVVEGFYGRPWTTEQRKNLFKRMNKIGMNTYLYAPKDDSKHRMYWRDLYSVEEADHLTGLIEAAAAQDVTFVYALSPGLDMTYSSSKELSQLKRKLQQVASFGCKCFALLFDDIDVDMSETDKEIFQSIALAQVSVTNEVYQHLGQPSFLFCPTEYCASRAVPAVSSSEYLKTLGSKLLPGVDIMWTGPKVISKDITMKSIEEISNVLCRPPVIWDNIHANDYDPKRVFLGPYDGRSPELVPHLKGVLTNPNCEFEANYIALHTLASWCKSSQNGVKNDIISESPVSADIELETNGEMQSIQDLSLPSTVYQPHKALAGAVADWFDEFNIECALVTKKMATSALPPSGPIVSVCPVDTITTSSVPVAIPSVTPGEGGPVKNLNQLNDSYLQPCTVGLVNSLVDPVSTSDTDSESSLSLCGEQEPMDCMITPGSSPTSDHSVPILSTPQKTTSDTACDIVDTCPVAGPQADTMSVDSDGPTAVCTNCKTDSITCTCSCTMQTDLTEDTEFSIDDLHHLVDLFYLPFDHGSRAVLLLQELVWLRGTAHRVTEAKSSSSTVTQKDLSAEWEKRAHDFQQKLNSINSALVRLCSAPNKAIVGDLFPYVYDLHSIISLTETFVKWLALGHLPYISVCYLQGNPCTWANDVYRQSFSSGFQEPWCFRGGIQAEFQHLLPLDGALDLLVPVLPRAPTLNVAAVRPFKPEDEAAVYEIARKTCDDRLDGTDIFPEKPDLIGDKLAGSFVCNSPEYCFVIVGSDGAICGYVLAALDMKEFSKKCKMAWLPHMRSKYPKPDKLDGLSPAEEIISSFHGDRTELSETLFKRFPSVVRMDVLPEASQDLGVVRRALACSVAAMKANGSHGIHTEVSIGDKNTLDFYRKVGFFILPPEEQPEDVILLGRVV